MKASCLLITPLLKITWNGKKRYIYSVAIVVGAVNMWNSPDSPENTGVQTPFEWLKRLCKTVRNRLDNF